jgi:hypothetical protein
MYGFFLKYYSEFGSRYKILSIKDNKGREGIDNLTEMITGLMNNKSCHGLLGDIIAPTAYYYITSLVSDFNSWIKEQYKNNILI